MLRATLQRGLGWNLFPQIPSSHRPVYYGFLFLFFLAIGVYWTLIPVKMGVFVALVGVDHDPNAKLGTLVLLFPLLLAYNRVLRSLSDRRKIGYFVFLFYGACFLVM